MSCSEERDQILRDELSGLDGVSDISVDFQ